jgi:hypothetical protein
VPSGEALRFAGNLSPELSSSDTVLAIDFDPLASFVANRSGREYFLHWRPVGLDPTTVMALGIDVPPTLARADEVIE